MENKDNVAPDPISKSTVRGIWKSGSANLMFDGIVIEFRENISESTQSAITGIVKQVSSLLKPSHNDWITIRITPFDPVIMALIAPMDIEFPCICLNRSTTDSEIKFTVAQVSSKARHLTGLFLQSTIYTNALVNNCGVDKREIVAKAVVLLPINKLSHVDGVVNDFDASTLFAVA